VQRRYREGARKGRRAGADLYTRLPHYRRPPPFEPLNATLRLCRRCHRLKVQLRDPFRSLLIVRLAGPGPLLAGFRDAAVLASEDVRLRQGRASRKRAKPRSVETGQRE
jgi:hypothetical protein